MTILVADIGGTNTRLALARRGGIIDRTIAYYRNGDHASIGDILTQYLGAGDVPDRIEACCVAIAGPVFGGRGRLTNIDWEISEAELKSITGAPYVRVLNDLTALGFALGHLPDASQQCIRPAVGAGGGNGQSLVIGIGTGFNVCPAVTLPNGKSICLESESGHADLPVRLRDVLHDHVGAGASVFETLEDLFSGAGLARFHKLLSKGDVRTPEQITGAADGRATVETYAQLVAILCQELFLRHFPQSGIHLAGSVARGIIGSRLGLRAFAATDVNINFAHRYLETPIYLLTDDAAALAGCVQAALGGDGG